MTSPENPGLVDQSLSIRELQREDADAIRKLNDLILGPDRSKSWDEYIEQFLTTSRLGIMSMPSWGSQVAEADGQIVGFILAERQTAGYGLPTGVRIVALAVDPSFRRKGVGRALVDALMTHCKERGVANIYSVLQEGDERDAGFLAACGFKPAPVKVYTIEL